MSISIIDKATQKQLSVVGQEVSLHGPSVIRLTGKRSELHQVVREGDSLNLTLASGAVIKVHGFFPAQGPQQNQLVLQDGKQLLQMESVDDGLVSARAGTTSKGGCRRCSIPCATACRHR